jgi:hypothetical protein
MPLTAREGPPPPGMVGDPYDAKLDAEGGTEPYTWELAPGCTLPAGLSLDRDTGTISGSPTSTGTTRFTVQVTDRAAETAPLDFFITIVPALRISRKGLPQGFESPRYSAELRAEGGTAPYTWELAPGGTLPAGLSLDRDTGTITGSPTSSGTMRFTVQATDVADHRDRADFSITLRRTSWWRHPLQSLSQIGTWLAVLGLGVPIVGFIVIFIYAFATYGSHWTYVAVGMVTALAALWSGCFVGFLFGIPRVVSSGQLRHEVGTLSYSPNSNLAEVSDWLTKLLLGAGLVQLTHLGPPIARLIDYVAAGLHSTAASTGAAKVMAGAILFGYVVVGVLDGYVVTTVWYQNKIANLGANS